MRTLLQIPFLIIGLIIGVILSPFYLVWLLFDHRPKCITCGERYAHTEGVYGECSNCLFKTEPAEQSEPLWCSQEALEEQQERARVARDIFEDLQREMQKKPPVQPPIFKDGDFAPFTFGVDQDGQVVVRQINEIGEESWQYVGHDGTRL